MTARRVAVIGSGHLARRIRTLVTSRGHELVSLSHGSLDEATRDVGFGAVGHALDAMDLTDVRAVYVVDDRDERNLEVLVALLSMRRSFTTSRRCSTSTSHRTCAPRTPTSTCSTRRGSRRPFSSRRSTSR